MNRPQINQTVQLLESLVDEQLAAGTVGVIVAEFEQPEAAYEVEFCDDRGETITTVALRPSQFKVIA
jgi:hypothetical protein